MSKRTVEKLYIYSTSIKILLVTQCTCSMVACYALSQIDHLELTSTRLMGMTRCTHFRNNFFLKTLDTVGNKLIGQHDLTASGFFSGLKIGIICTTFHCGGTELILKTALKSCVRYTILTLSNSWRCFPVIKSYHGAFFRLIEYLMRSLTSCFVKYLGGSSK